MGSSGRVGALDLLLPLPLDADEEDEDMAGVMLSYMGKPFATREDACR